MANTLARFFVCCMAVVVPSAAVHSAIVTVPADVSSGDTYRLAFVTSVSTDATSTDIADYNDFVTIIANFVPELAELHTTWKALVSSETVNAYDNTDTNPANFSASNVPIYNLAGAAIAFENQSFWGAFHNAPLNIDELGTTLSVIVWTGTTVMGTTSPGDAVGGSFIGIVDVGDTASPYPSAWINSGARDARESHYLYAISGVITAPEPSTFILAALGGLALLAWRRRG